MSAPESRYSAFDRELFAAYSSLCHFPFMLEGRQFILFTDHKPLMFALIRTSPPWSTMQQRRLSFLSEFNCEIRHLPGLENVVADALTRPEPSNVPQILRQQHWSLSSNQLLRRQFQEYLSPKCPFYNSPAQRLNFSAVHQPYLLFLFPTQVLISSVTCPLVSSAPWFRRRWEGRCWVDSQYFSSRLMCI